MTENASTLHRECSRLVSASEAAGSPWRARKSDIAAGLKALTDWSALHASELVHAPRAASKAQESVEFRRVGSDHVFWMAYPASKAGMPKVEFLTRGQTRFPDCWAAVGEKWTAEIGVAPAQDQVIGLPLVYLAKPSQFARLGCFLEWVLVDPCLASLRTGT